MGVNFGDLLMLVGQYQEKPPLPFSPGSEGAGVVMEVGEGVKSVKKVCLHFETWLVFLYYSGMPDFGPCLLPISGFFPGFILFMSRLKHVKVSFQAHWVKQMVSLTTVNPGTYVYVPETFADSPHSWKFIFSAKLINYNFYFNRSQ